MRIDPLDHGLILNAPTEGYVRTPGLHISELYNSLYADLEPARYAKGDGPDMLKMEVGTSFEDVLEPAIRKRIVGAERPGEYATQHAVDCIHHKPVRVGDPVCPCGAGIIYSPDHFLFNGVFRLGELKLTWMSIRKGINDHRFLKWFTQMRVYCYHLGTPYARLYALFINGDYTNYSPQLRAWDIEFTQKELTEEWRVLLRQGRKMGVIPS